VRLRHIGVAVPAGVLLLCACRSTSAALRRRDSAGIAIVENAQHETAAGDSIWIETAPLADIGGGGEGAALSALTVDRAGRLWVEDSRVSPGDAGRAAVFDSTGHWLSSPTLPASFTISDIGADYVLGIGVDESGVEHVRMYRLRSGR
jgi:hypothetical protein